jgi:hypothetical protein
MSPNRPLSFGEQEHGRDLGIGCVSNQLKSNVIIILTSDKRHSFIQSFFKFMSKKLPSPTLMWNNGTVRIVHTIDLEGILTIGIYTHIIFLIITTSGKSLSDKGGYCKSCKGTVNRFIIGSQGAEDHVVSRMLYY